MVETIVQVGIARVVAPRPLEAHVRRWEERDGLAEKLFREAGVEVDLITIAKHEGKV